MTQDRAISDSVDRLKALLEDKFGLRRGDLAQRAAKAWVDWFDQHLLSK